MDADISKRLVSMIHIFLDKLDIGGTLEKCRESGVLNSPEVLAITNETSPEGQVFTLVYHLRQKMKETQLKFIQLLRSNANHEEIAAILTDPSKETGYRGTRSRDTEQTYLKVQHDSDQNTDSNRELAEENEDLRKKVAECERETQIFKKECERINKKLNSTQEESEMFAATCERLAQTVQSQIQRRREFKASSSDSQDRGTEYLHEERYITDVHSELERCQLDLRHTESSLATTAKNLSEAEEQLKISTEKEVRLKRQLRLPASADEKQVREQVRRLIADNKKNRDELNKSYQDLRNVRLQNQRLKTDVDTLKREKDSLGFDFRQLKSRYTRLSAQRSLELVARRRSDNTTMKTLGTGDQSHTGATRVDLVLNQTGLERSGTRPSLPPISLRSNPDLEFCLLCHKDVNIEAGSPCKIHYRSLRNGRWACCGDDRHTQFGCVTVKHLYLERDARRNIMLTTGISSIKIPQ